jgi:hypothetical protein
LYHPNFNGHAGKPRHHFVKATAHPFAAPPLRSLIVANWASHAAQIAM